MPRRPAFVTVTVTVSLVVTLIWAVSILSNPEYAVHSMQSLDYIDSFEILEFLLLSLVVFSIPADYAALLLSKYAIDQVMRSQDPRWRAGAIIVGMLACVFVYALGLMLVLWILLPTGTWNWFAEEAGLWDWVSRGLDLMMTGLVLGPLVRFWGGTGPYGMVGTFGLFA